MQIQVLGSGFSILRLENEPSIPPGCSFSFTSRTDEEISLVIESNYAPSAYSRREDGWRALKLMGPLDLSLVGILSKLLTVLADNGIGIFAISTYDTDYVLVREENLTKAVEVLQQAGYQFI